MQERIWLWSVILLLLGAAGCSSGQGMASAVVTPVPGETVAPTAVSTTPPATPSATTATTAETAVATRPHPTNTAPSPTTTSTPLSQPSPTPTPPPRTFATPDGALPTPPTAIPTAMAPFPRAPEVINIALVGNDTEWAQGGRTDTIIIVSINQETQTATMLSLPRDLYVYIPGWTMSRINAALPHGHGSDYPGGGGALLKDTILYNFGIPIDYYARIGFNGFKRGIDIMGGVEVVSNCRLRDWRLKSPELDPDVEENWGQFTLEPGLHTMDGDLALWYVRSRRTTNDFERGRRQQEVLQAMLVKGASMELVTQVPELWETFQEQVETDMDLALVLKLAAIASEVRDNGIHHLSLATAVKGWLVPTTGEAVQLMEWEEAEPIFRQFMQPPALNRAARPPLTVEVVTGSTIYYRLAADNLLWHGFVPIHGQTTEPPPAHTQITYYGPNLKGAFSELLSWNFNQDPSEIKLVKDKGASPYNYRVILGNDFDSCLSLFETP